MKSEIRNQFNKLNFILAKCDFRPLKLGPEIMLRLEKDDIKTKKEG